MIQQRIPARRFLACCLLLTVLLPKSFVPASDLRRTAIVRAVQQASPAVVNIHGHKTLIPGQDQFVHVDGPKRVNGMGTGVVIDPRGYIITNHHVIEGVRQIQVTLDDGRTYIARPIARDSETDLAVIKISTKKPLSLLRVGTSSDLMIGEPVVAVGNAYGYEHTVTRGIISALHRNVQVTDTQRYNDLLQTDASINPGNSGGPLLNIDGEMIAINVAVRVGAQGIGFAIPIDRVMDVAAQMLSAERLQGSWHGIGGEDSVRGAEPQLVVRSVASDSPAAAGGLETDDVITHVGDTKIERQLDLERALLGRRPGDEIPVKLTRDGEPVSLSLVMASAPRVPAGQPDRTWQALGMRLVPVPGEQFRRYNSRYRGGVKITSVRPGGPADRQGIRPGDVLVGMHVWETISLENISYILNRPGFNNQDAIKFYILRNNETLFGHLPVTWLR